MSGAISDVTKIPEAFKIKSSHYVIAGLSLVTALSWNDAIKVGIEKVYTIPKDRVSASFLYAIIITILLIFVIWMLPNTKSELPHDTQKVIQEAEKTEELNKLREEVDQLKAERFTRLGRMEKMSMFRV